MASEVRVKTTTSQEYSFLAKDIIMGSIIMGIVVGALVAVLVSTDLANHGVSMHDRAVAGGMSGATAGGTFSIFMGGVGLGILTYRMNKKEQAEKELQKQQKMLPLDGSPSIN